MYSKVLYIYIFSFGFFSIIGYYKIFNIVPCAYIGGFPGGSEVKVSACNAGDLGSIPGLGRSPGEGNGNPLQYSCLENPMDRGAWWATVHGVAKSQTGLSDFTFTFRYADDTTLMAESKEEEELKSLLMKEES